MPRARPLRLSRFHGPRTGQLGRGRGMPQLSSHLVEYGDLGAASSEPDDEAG